MMVRDFQLVIGKEVKSKYWKRKTDCPIILLPALAAVVIRWGLFHPFIEDKEVKMIGVVAGGRDLALVSTHLRY